MEKEMEMERKGKEGTGREGKEREGKGSQTTRKGTRKKRTKHRQVCISGVVWESMCCIHVAWKYRANSETRARILDTTEETLE